MFCFFLGWKSIQEHFNLLCNALPDNYQLILSRLETMQCFSTAELNQLNKLISSSADVRIVNKKIVTYLFVKLCYSNSNRHLAKRYVMNEYISKSAGCLKQEVQNGMYRHVHTYVTESTKINHVWANYT